MYRRIYIIDIKLVIYVNTILMIAIYLAIYFFMTSALITGSKKNKQFISSATHTYYLKIDILHIRNS